MTRLSHALNSSDLSHRETDCDVDVVGAAGHAGAVLPLGMLLAEVRQCAAGEGAAVTRLRELQVSVEVRIPGWARRGRIVVRARPVALLLVREYVDTNCPRCAGRGFLPLSYGVEVEDAGKQEVDCPACLGSGQGKRNLRDRADAAGFESYGRSLADFWEYALGKMHRAEVSALGVMTFKLGGR